MIENLSINIVSQSFKTSIYDNIAHEGCDNN